MRFGILKIAAWACFGAILLVALTPVGVILDAPSSFLDRAFRYVVLATLMVFAYPKRPLPVAAIVLTLAVGGEFLQLLLPWKSPSALNVIPKLAGGSLGTAVGYMIAMASFAIQRRP